MIEPIGAFVLDFDGVVADSMPVQEDAWRQAISQVAPSLSELQKERLLKNLWAGHAGKRMFEGTHISPSLQSQLRQIKDAIWEKKRQFIPAVFGVNEAARKLRNIAPLFISTTAPRKYVESNLRRFSIYDFFDKIVTDEDVTNPKPAPDALFLISALAGIPPNQLMVIGDTITDQEMARAAGSQFILFTPHVNPYINAECTKQYFEWRVLVIDLCWERVGWSEERTPTFHARG